MPRRSSINPLTANFKLSLVSQKLLNNQFYLECTLRTTIHATFSSAEKNLEASIGVKYFNPLITNDAYMRLIIVCAEVPMTHICVKDEGAHFHGIFGCCEGATALNSSQQIQQSSGYPLADISSLSSAYAMRNQAPNFTRSCARSRSFQLREQITQKTRQVGQRLAVELLHLLELYYITTNCVQWYILARCMRQRTYSMFTFFFRKERVLKVQST